jgi:hypothetical protein
MVQVHINHPTYLSVMVGRMFCHRAGQLGHLYLSLVIPLETSEQHLPLTRLQSYTHTNMPYLSMHSHVKTCY